MPPAHPSLLRPGKEYMAQAVDGASAKGGKNDKARLQPELRDACSLKQGQFRQYLYQARDLI